MEKSKVEKIINKINSKAIDNTNNSSNIINIDKNDDNKKSTPTIPQKKIDKILTVFTAFSTLESFRSFAENLKYSPLEISSVNYKILHITNGMIKDDICNIIIKIPKLRIRSIYQINQKIKQSVPIKLSINTSSTENNKLLTFITRLENEIGRKIKSITGNKKLVLSSCITKYSDYYPDLKVSAPFARINNCIEFAFQIYGKKNKQINFSSIDKGVKISCFVELEHVWVNDNTYGLSLIIKQAKVYPERVWSNNVFDDEEWEEDDDLPKECYHCMYCPNNHVRTHCCLGNQNIIYSQNTKISIPETLPLPPPPPPPQFHQIVKNSTLQEEKKSTFVPTLKDLLAGRSKLKSVSTNNEAAIDNICENNDDKINLEKIKNNLKNIN